MSYIGRGTESISNVEVLDNLTFDGSASYTLQKSSVNFVPSSANNLLISISGVVQQGNFSVSGSTITFDTTVSGSDTCDWILHYGIGLITTVADGTITEAKLGSNAVTTAKINNGAVSYAKTDGNFGKIGQVISFNYATGTNITSSSYTDITNGGVSITPSSTSSKVLVHFHTLYGELGGGGDDTGVNIAIYRGGSAIYNGGAGGINTRNFYIRSVGASSLEMGFSPNFIYLDSPSTTSSTTYQIYASVEQGGNCNFTRPKYIILQEVLA
jgi:hypothetical protein